MRNIVIVDIDGTLTKVGSRVECLSKSPPDWDEFYRRCGEDAPVNDMIKMIRCLSIMYPIVLCTGRRESCREATEEWLKVNGPVPYLAMFMRPNGDHRPDTELKPWLLAQNRVWLSDIVFVLEDRASMVKKWRELGLICLQVAEGSY